MMRRWLSLGALLLAALPAAAGWYSASWPYRVEFNVDPTYVNEDCGAIILNAANLNTDFWTHVQGVGDIRVTEDDGTTEVAIHNIGFVDSGTTGTDQIRIAYGPSASVVTSGFVYYGNSGASLPSSSDTYGSENAYDANILSAYTFEGGALTDATGNGNTLTNTGSATTTTGPFAGLTAFSFNGSSQYLSRTSAAVTDWPMTIETWFYPDNATSNGTLAGVSNSASSNNFAVLQALGGVASDPVEAAFRDATNASSAQTIGFAATTWQYAVGTRDADAGTSSVYIDAGTAGTDSTTLTTPSFNRTAIGVLIRTSNANYFAGDIGYTLFHNVARSADYISTMYNFWANQAAMVEFGPEEDKPGTNDTGWVEFTSATGDYTNNTYAVTDLIKAASGTVPDATTFTITVTDASSALSALSGTIAGIEVRIGAICEKDGNSDIRDDNLQLVIGGSASGTNKSSVTQWDGTSGIEWRVYGGPTDTWGLSPTDTQLKASNAGVTWRVDSGGGSSADVDIYRIDWRIYTASAASSTTGFFRLLR